MALKIRCPQTDCRAFLKVKDGAAGKKIKCPKCKAVIKIPDRSKSESEGTHQVEQGVTFPRGWALQSRKLWLTFFLGVIPVVLLSLGLLAAIGDLTCVMKPFTFTSTSVDRYGNQQGSTESSAWLIGADFVGYTVISNGAMGAIAIAISGLIAFMWYAFLWRLGSKNK